MKNPPAEPEASATVTSSRDRPTAYESTLAADETTKPPRDISRDETVAYGAVDAGPAIKLPDARYEVKDALGAGGMGEVRSVRDAWIGRDVARKTLLADLRETAQARVRFLREIRVQGQLEHPGIVPVYDVSVGRDGELSFTMRRVKGRTLAAVVEGLARGDRELAARYSRRRLLTAFSSVCMAIHYAHTRGVVHRDLKPSNIMLGEFGEVYVLDWGIAKLVGEDPSVEDFASAEISTEGNRIIGTLGYMAPEQANADNDAIDARTDVYALGVMLFEILTLDHVLVDLDAADALRAITDGVDARPTRRPRGADVPPELETICVRATSRAPADRFASAQAISEAVERYLDGDRDLERRRELAAGYAAEAAALAARALAPATPPAEADEARTEAMRGTLHALALSPEQPDAQHTLARLLLEVPKELPPAAKAAHEEMRISARTEGARLGWRAFISYTLAFPLMVVMGIKSWLMIGVGMTCTITAAVVARYAYTRRAVQTTGFMLLLLLSAGIVVVQGTWLGPFVLLPTSATLTVSLFTLYANRRERSLVFAAGACMFLLPFLADVLGLVPPGFSFEPGGVLLHERTLGLTKGATIVGLIYSCTGYILLPVVFIGRLRDTMSVVEDRQFLQAWYMKRMFPKAVAE
jgi:serine/threonine-protein kinase